MGVVLGKIKERIAGNQVVDESGQTVRLYFHVRLNASSVTHFSAGGSMEDFCQTVRYSPDGTVWVEMAEVMSLYAASAGNVVSAGCDFQVAAIGKNPLPKVRAPMTIARSIS